MNRRNFIARLLGISAAVALGKQAVDAVAGTITGRWSHSDVLARNFYDVERLRHYCLTDIELQCVAHAQQAGLLKYDPKSWIDGKPLEWGDRIAFHDVPGTPNGIYKVEEIY